MTDAELLIKIKEGLMITGDFQDEALKLYINEVKEYLLSAGVKREVLDSSVSVGIIVRGVCDLWNNQGSNTDFSSYFIQRAIQLVSASKDGEVKNE